MQNLQDCIIAQQRAVQSAKMYNLFTISLRRQLAHSEEGAEVQRMNKTIARIFFFEIFLCLFSPTNIPSCSAAAATEGVNFPLEVDILSIIQVHGEPSHLLCLLMKSSSTFGQF